MKKVQVRELQEILQDHINLHKNIRTQNVNKAIEKGDLEKPIFKKFLRLTDMRISKAENLLPKYFNQPQPHSYPLLFDPSSLE